MLGTRRGSVGSASYATEPARRHPAKPALARSVHSDDEQVQVRRAVSTPLHVVLARRGDGELDGSRGFTWFDRRPRRVESISEDGVSHAGVIAECDCFSRADGRRIGGGNDAVVWGERIGGECDDDGRSVVGRGGIDARRERDSSGGGGQREM